MGRLGRPEIIYFSWLKKPIFIKKFQLVTRNTFFYYLKFPLGAQVLFESQIRGNDHLSHCLTKWHQQISSHCEYSLLEEQPLSPRSVQVFAWKDLPRMRKFQLLLVEVAEVPFRPWYLKLLKNFVKSKFKVITYLLKFVKLCTYLLPLLHHHPLHQKNLQPHLGLRRWRLRPGFRCRKLVHHFRVYC